MPDTWNACKPSHSFGPDNERNFYTHQGSLLYIQHHYYIILFRITVESNKINASWMR